MTKKVISYLVVASYCYCSGALSNESVAPPLKNYCQIQIDQYQKDQSCFHTRQARAEHLLDLIRASQNKFKLINDMYLHYRSIDDTSSELSQRLELCLVNLLKLSVKTGDFNQAIEKRNASLIQPSKLQDPVHEAIAAQIVNQKYLALNQAALNHLVCLDNIETSFFYYSIIDKNVFDLAVPIDEARPFYELGPSEVLSNLLRLSEDIAQQLVSQAQKEADTFAELPRVKEAVKIHKLSRKVLSILENRIPLSNLPKIAPAYEAVTEYSPQGLGWHWEANDGESFLTKVKEFKNLLAKNDALMTDLDNAIRNFVPTRQKIAEMRNAVEALYGDVVIICDKYLEIEQLNNNKNKAIIANLKELKRYARQADKIIHNKITAITNNRDLSTIELVKQLAEDLIEALNERGDDVRERIESAFGDC